MYAGTPAQADRCTRCYRALAAKEALRCCKCGVGFHYSCYGVPEELFPNRLQIVDKPEPHTLGNHARLGDTRRPDFRCPTCNFRAVMRRQPRAGHPKDSWLIMLDVRAQLDEMIADSTSYAASCMYALRRATRFGQDFGIPVMVAHDREELQLMNTQLGAVGHVQLRWWLADRTRGVTWDTTKKERSAIFNFYRAMGWDSEHIPTSTPKFTNFMNGMLQRKGESTTQCATFRAVLIKDMCALLLGEVQRARGARRLALAKVQLAWHAYMQVGARANELFGQTLGRLVRGFCFGEVAERKEIVEHLKFDATIQTKENRFSGTTLWCCARTERQLLETGPCAQLLVMELERQGITDEDYKVFSDGAGVPWKMGAFWSKEVVPRLEQLQKEKLGGLENEDLSLFGSNSFRRTWATLAASRGGGGVVDEHLRARQGRWRTEGRGRCLGQMVHLYNDPVPEDLLLATMWL